jgi:hypothetical protein
MTEPLFVHLRNKISGVVATYSPAEAKQWQEHPVFGPNLEEVRTDKPEILKSDAKAKEDAKSDSDSKEK